MNKSTLKEVIQNVVAHKLAEASGKAPKYGYIISGKKSEDPSLQLIGYGNMPKSYWQRKLEGYADELAKKIKDGNWTAAAYYMQEKSVFNLAVNMMKEIYDQDLKEVQTSMDSTDIDKSFGDRALSDMDKKELEKLKIQGDKQNDGIKKIEGDVAKLQQTIQPKIQRAERVKANLQKKQAATIRRQQSILRKAT